MIKVELEHLIRAVADMPAWAIVAPDDAVVTVDPSGGPGFTARQVRLFVLQHLSESLGPLGLNVTKAHVDEMCRKLSPEWPTQVNEKWRQFAEEFASRLKDEAESRVFLCIPTERQGFYVQEDKANTYPTPEIAQAFPSASFDLVHASRCYAYGEATAAVFHAMRALEVVVRALAKRLSIKLAKKKALDYQDVGTVSAAIQSKVADHIKKKKRGPLKAAMLGFYQPAAFQLDRAMDVWRNPVAHARTRFDDEAARRILAATHELLEHVVKGGLKEPL